MNVMGIMQQIMSNNRVMGNPMIDRIYVRVTKQEKKEIMDFSSESGYSILELIRIGIEKIRSQKK